MDEKSLAKRRDLYKDGLLNDTLSFWFPRCIDTKYGGYMTCRNRDGTLLDTDKGIWQQGRTAWLLGKLYNTVEKRDEWLEWAKSGIQFLDRYGFDPTDGRLWFHVTCDGRPLRKRRYASGETFAALAYGEYARATGSSVYAEKAAHCFDRFLNHIPPAKFTDVRPAQSIGNLLLPIGTAQELRESIGLETANALIDRSIEKVKTDHLKAELETVMETVGPGGLVYDHFEGRMLNPGHAIECAWFILEEGRIRNDTELVELGCTMLDWMWERGWDKDYGGILYFVDLHGKPVSEYWHDMKFWWPQNEVIIATLLAHELTEEDRYAKWYQEAHNWAYRHFPDTEHGEWFGYLHRDGSLSNTLKGNIWKGPFHLPRMQLTCWKTLDRMIG